MPACIPHTEPCNACISLSYACSVPGMYAGFGACHVCIVLLHLLLEVSAAHKILP